jgi:hypothetical protein
MCIYKSNELLAEALQEPKEAPFFMHQFSETRTEEAYCDFAEAKPLSPHQGPLVALGASPCGGVNTPEAASVVVY